MSLTAMICDRGLVGIARPFALELTSPNPPAPAGSLHRNE